MAYLGYRNVQMSEREIEALFRIGMAKGLDDMEVNEHLIIYNSYGKVFDSIIRAESDWIRLKNQSKKVFEPKNGKQQAMSNMFHPGARMNVRLIGGAIGAGKTKCAMSFGMSELKNNKVDKLVFVRSLFAESERTGHGPFSKTEDTFARSMYLQESLEEELKTENLRTTRQTVGSTIDGYLAGGRILIEDVDYIDGREFRRSFVLVDNCEMLTREQIKLVGQTIGAGSQLCMIADFDDLDDIRAENFLELVEHVKGKPGFGVVIFNEPEADNVRSEISKEFSKF